MGASYNLAIIAGSSNWSDEPFGDDYSKKPADWGSNPYVPTFLNLRNVYIVSNFY